MNSLKLNAVGRTDQGRATGERERDGFWKALGRAWLVAAVLLFGAQQACAADGRQAMVATVHPLATEAGLNVLKNGGNAVDAAVTAALMLGVVDGFNSGIGGGCFILIHAADGQLVAIDGRETAPAKATRGMYLKDGQPRPEWSQTGPRAVATPGALAAYEIAVHAAGKKQLRELFLPAATVAEAGFLVDDHYAAKIKAEIADLARFDGSRAVFFHVAGQQLKAGDTLKQPDLAATYRAIARQGLDWFYQGPFARRVGDWMAAHGGILTAEDFATYEPVARRPLKTMYRGYTVVGFPPPSSGGVHVAQILNTLEPFDLAKLRAEDPAGFSHVLAEAMKLAFADRFLAGGRPLLSSGV